MCRAAKVSSGRNCELWDWENNQNRRDETMGKVAFAFALQQFGRLLHVVGKAGLRAYVKIDKI